MLMLLLRRISSAFGARPRAIAVADPFAARAVIPQATPALPILFAGETELITARAQVIDTATGEWADEDLTGATFETCLLSEDGKTRHTPIVAGALIDGRIGVVVTGAHTAALLPGKYLVDIRRTDGGSRTYLRPTVQLLPGRPAAGPS